MKINQRKGGATLSYVNMIVGFVVSLISTPIILRLLGQSEYGLYNLVASVVAYLGVLNFGFGSAYVRYFSRYKAKEDQEKIATLNGMFILIFSVLGFIAVVAGFVLAQYTDVIFGNELTLEELRKAKILMYVLVLNLGFSFPSIAFTSYITANERFIFQRAIQLLRIFINPFLILTALLLGYGSIGMALATSVLNLAIEIVYMLYCLRKLEMKFSFKGIERGLLKEISVFSSFIFFNMVIDQINWNLDNFIIGRYQGTAGVAIYAVAATLNNYYLQISSAVSNVFVPRVHRMVADSDDNHALTELFTRIGRIQFMLLAMIGSGLVFFGKPFIMKWAGQDYGESYYVALLLILPVTIPLIQNIGIEIQRAKNMHRFRSVVYFFIALGNLAFSIPLTIRYGAFGAAAGTALSLLLGNGLIMNLYNHYKVGLNMKHFWKEIMRFIPALLVPVIFGSFIMNYADLNQGLLLAVFGILYIGIYLLSMWHLGMNVYEKNLIREPVRRLFKRDKIH